MPQHLTGLAPLDSDRPRLQQRPYRRQAGREEWAPPATRLTPSAAPVDTYARPAQAGGGTQWEQLAQGLSDLSPALRQFTHQRRLAHIDSAMQQATDKIGGMTWEQRQEAVRNGLPEFEDEWFKAAFMRAHGESAAIPAREALLQAYATDFDPETGNLDELIQTVRTETLEAMGQDPLAMRGFDGAFSRYANALREKHTERRTEQFVAHRRQQVMDGFRSVLLAGKDSRATPDTIAEALWSRAEAQKELLRVPMQDQQKILIELLGGVAAEGDTRTLQAVLDAERPDGGKLADTQGLQQHLLTLQAIAQRNALSKAAEAAIPARDHFRAQASRGALDADELSVWRTANPGIISDDQALALLGAQRHAAEARYVQEQQELARMERVGHDLAQATPGSGPGLFFLKDAEVPDGKGGIKVVSAEDRRKEARDFFLKSSAEHAARKEEPLQAQVHREAAWLAHNGMDNPGWSTLLNRGFLGATASATARDDPPPALAKSLELYQTLYAAYPTLLDAHMKDGAARLFYDTYRIHTEYLGVDSKTAMEQALNASRDPEFAKSPHVQTRLAELDQNMPDPPGWDTYTNTAQMRSELSRIARTLVIAGADPARALEEAQARIEATHMQIGKAMVPVGASVPDREGFRVYAEDYLEKFAEENGYDQSDFMLRPVNNGDNTWIVTTSLGIPIPGGRITLDGYRQMLAAEQGQELQALLHENKLARRGETESFLTKAMTGRRYVPPKSDVEREPHAPDNRNKPEQPWQHTAQR
ncbi:hypothetical protein HEQ69_10870 [Haematospirillum jordaniae]|uniref:hypothetical protein n=1 Tax=Haematospirillum jordaniae TaxID=1549855 RepID=UPI001433279B|nr:hypothetical protein [Haematospirillum jordaniae]NKD46205.1 hypothetical protein [Haematospirillum jordaniae]